jgi:Co/Zn/Cd efflux system component
MFLVELAWIKGESSGLVADSLDVFADATVFALSLYAVGRSIGLKK